MNRQFAMQVESKPEEKKQTKDGRSLCWTFIVYPDSAPEEWRKTLDTEMIPWVESPLHEGEKNPDNETEKKSHWHILLIFHTKKSFDQIREISKSLNATTPQICRNAKGLVRYMVHMDNPEKKQYSVSDIISHCGADVASYLRATGAARYELIAEMMDFVKQNNVVEIKELLFYARDNRFEDWFPLLCDNSAYILGELIKSNRHSQKEEIKWVEVEICGEEKDKDNPNGVDKLE